MQTGAFLLLLAGQVIGYLVGGIPFAYLVTWWKTGKDIRTIGSGNVGATNVGRLLGFPYFVLVFLLDLAKGALPVLAATLIEKNGSLPGADFLPEAVGFAAIIGHVFPIYLGMKGGKGVATTIGVLVCLVPIPTVAGLGAWILIVLATRMVSAGSIAFAATFCAVHLWITPEPWSTQQIARTALVVAIALLVIIKHRSNIGRIFTGTEPRISFGRSGTKKDEPAESHAESL